MADITIGEIVDFIEERGGADVAEVTDPERGTVRAGTARMLVENGFCRWADPEHTSLQVIPENLGYRQAID